MNTQRPRDMDPPSNAQVAGRPSESVTSRFKDELRKVFPYSVEIKKQPQKMAR